MLLNGIPFTKAILDITWKPNPFSKTTEIINSE